MKCLIPLAMFIGQQVMMMLSMSMDLHLDTLYTAVPDIVIEPLIQLHTRLDPAKLDYVNSCDESFEGKDIKWTPVAVLLHEFRFKP